MGVLIGSCISALILCFNIAVLVVAATKNPGFKNGFAEPFTSKSWSMSQLSSAIHIVINVLSTILLSASNYTMQVLSSPTRAEIDRAHGAGRWFDIGALSFHNLKRISWTRVFLCVALILSSVPLHLLFVHHQIYQNSQQSVILILNSFNSTAIYIAATNEFNVYLLPSGSKSESAIRANANLTRFSNQQWRHEYNSDVVDYGDLYLTVDDYASWVNVTNVTGLPTKKDDIPPQYQFPIDINIPFGNMTFNITDWINITQVYQRENETSDITRYAHVIEGYGSNIPSRSRIQISLSFLIIVIACNAIKLGIMVWVLYMEKSDFVVTIGDAVASFLEHRDDITEKYCTFNKDAITAEVAHRGARNGISYSNLSSSSEPSKAGTVPKTDYLDELVLNSSGVWRDQTYPYSSALAKDREMGSSFMYAQHWTPPSWIELTPIDLLSSFYLSYYSLSS